MKVTGSKIDVTNYQSSAKDQNPYKNRFAFTISEFVMEISKTIFNYFYTFPTFPKNILKIDIL